MLTGYLLLLLALLLIWVLGFALSDYELLAPASLVPLAMIASVVLAVLGMGGWNDVTLTFNAISVTALGTASFVLGCLLFNKVIVADGRGLRGILRTERHTQLDVSGDNAKYWILLAVMVVLTLLHMSEMVKLYGGDLVAGFSQIAKEVRQSTSSVFSSQGISLEDGFPLYDRVLSKIRSAIGIISAAALPYESIVHRRRLRSLVPIVLTLLTSCAMTLISGSRSGMINTVFIFATSLFLCWQWREGALSAAKRMAAVFAVGVVVLPAAFYLSGFLVGRAPSAGAFDYITFYLGCPVPSLEKVMAQGIPATGVVGFNTFHEQYYLLNKLGAVGPMPAYGWFFLDIGEHPSNVFTFAYRFYADFGYLGTLLLGAATGIGFTALYRLACENIHRPAVLFCYATIGATLFDIMRDEKFFTSVLTANAVLTFAIVAVVTAWLYNDRIRFDRRVLVATPWKGEAA